jgi:hypothetical protein
MPYNINKLKKPCKQSDGDTGTWSLTYTDKKGKRHRNCHTSEKNAKKQISAIEAEGVSNTSVDLLELRLLVRRFLHEALTSHHDEPKIGDTVINTNPGCQHFGSEGIVLSVDTLPGDAGKTAEYQCTNGGTTWSLGDVLTKTLDQLDLI